jgi:hypothetical protein
MRNELNLFPPNVSRLLKSKERINNMRGCLEIYNNYRKRTKLERKTIMRAG